MKTVPFLFDVVAARSKCSPTRFCVVSPTWLHGAHCSVCISTTQRFMRARVDCSDRGLRLSLALVMIMGAQ